MWPSVPGVCGGVQGGGSGQRLRKRLLHPQQAGRPIWLRHWSGHDSRTGQPLPCSRLTGVLHAESKLCLQLEVSRKHIGYHMDLFGYSSPNVEFVEGYIEDLEGCGIDKESVDIVV